MDSDRPHYGHHGDDDALHENDLYRALTNFKDFWLRHREKINAVLVVILAVLLTYSIMRMVRVRREAAQAMAWNELSSATSPDGLAGVAAEHDLPIVQALAYLRGGDLLLSKAVTPEAGDPPADATSMAELPTPTPVSDEERTNALDRAEAMYQQALAVTGAPLAVQANARLGLAAVAETRGDYEQAAAQYQQALEQAQPTLPAIASQAQVRLEMLERISRPVTFADEPAPAPAPETQGNGAMQVAPPLLPTQPEATELPVAPDAPAEAETAPTETPDPPAEAPPTTPAE